MSKPSDTAVGNLKRLVGEVLATASSWRNKVYEQTGA